MKLNGITRNKCAFNVQNVTTAGESIEEKMRRVVLNDEPCDDGAPLVFTERADGVQPQYDIRTDRWELAQAAMNKVNATLIAQTEEAPNTNTPTNNEPTNNEPKNE